MFVVDRLLMHLAFCRWWLIVTFLRARDSLLVYSFHCRPAKASEDELKKIVKEYFDKWYNLEGEMFFLQREVILRDLQINELNMSVSDMKGKFIKPTLKKVSKYENKFAKLQEKAAKFAFANQLKAKDK
jgi:hypothetical protein